MWRRVCRIFQKNTQVLVYTHFLLQIIAPIIKTIDEITKADDIIGQLCK